jgi:hypothetical protein
MPPPPPNGSRVHDGALLDPIVSHINLIHHFHTLRAHLNIIFQSTSTAPCHAFPSGVRSKLLYVSYFLRGTWWPVLYRKTNVPGSPPSSTMICKICHYVHTSCWMGQADARSFLKLPKWTHRLNQGLFPYIVFISLYNWGGLCKLRHMNRVFVYKSD